MAFPEIPERHDAGRPWSRSGKRLSENNILKHKTRDEEWIVFLRPGLCSAGNSIFGYSTTASAAPGTAHNPLEQLFLVPLCDEGVLLKRLALLVEILNDIFPSDNSDKALLVVQHGDEVLIQRLADQVLHVGVRFHGAVVQAPPDCGNRDLLRALNPD